MGLRVSYAARASTEGAPIQADFVQRRHDGMVLFGLLEPAVRGSRGQEVLDLAHAHLDRVSLRRGIGTLVGGLHDALRPTVGANAFLGLYDRGAVHMSGVGPVSARAHGMPLHFETTAGLLGRDLHRIRSFSQHFVTGARLVAFNRGLDPGGSFPPAGTDPTSADALVARHASRGEEDALLLVADLIS